MSATRRHLVSALVLFSTILALHHIIPTAIPGYGSYFSPIVLVSAAGSSSSTGTVILPSSTGTTGAVTSSPGSSTATNTAAAASSTAQTTGAAASSSAATSATSGTTGASSGTAGSSSVGSSTAAGSSVSSTAAPGTAAAASSTGTASDPSSTAPVSSASSSTGAATDSSSAAAAESSTAAAAESSTGPAAEESSSSGAMMPESSSSGAFDESSSSGAAIPITPPPPGVLSFLPTAIATWRKIESTTNLPAGLNSTNTAGLDSDGQPTGRCDAGWNLRRNSGSASSLYMYGGLSNNEGTLSDMWRYDTTTFTWNFIHYNSSFVPASRTGAAIDYLTDFDAFIVFGGANVNYLDDVQLYEVATGKWIQIVPPSANGISNPGPAARSYAGWRRTKASSDSASPNVNFYELLLYGGTADTAGINTPFDLDQNDLWSYKFYRDTNQPVGSAGYYYGQWTALESNICKDELVVCADAIPLSNRFATLAGALSSFSSAVSSASYRPSQVVSLLDTMRSITHDMNTTAKDALAAFEALPAEQQTNDDTQCNKTCQRFEFDPDLYPLHPPKLEGHRGTIYNGSIVYFGGYLCLDHGVQFQGGPDCYSNTLWFLNLTDYSWSVQEIPNINLDDPDQVAAYPDAVRQMKLWPGPMAYHSQVVYNNRLYVYGGGYKAPGGVLTYYNKLNVFDLINRVWLNTDVRGTVPSPNWSSGLQVIPRTNTAFLFGGCTDDVYFNNVYQLLFDQKVMPENVKLSGPGVEKNITAGEETYFIIETREWIPSADGTTGTWGAILPWGTKQNFLVQLINEKRGLTKATVLELGGGVYNVTYTLTQGYQLQLYVLLDQTTNVRGSPFLIYNAPQEPDSKFVSIIAEPTIKGEQTSFIFQLQDPLGNYVHNGGDIKGALNVFGIPNTDAVNTVQLTINTDAPVAPTYFDPVFMINSITKLEDLADGTYRVTYNVPKGAFSTYNLFLYFNNKLFDSGNSPIPSVIITYDQSVLNPNLIIAGNTLTAICCVVVVGYMAMLTKHSEARVVKASSYFFLMTLCFGVLLCFASIFILSKTTDATCRAFPLVLGFGYNILIGSLFVKSQRIMSIFTTKKLQVLNLSNFKTGIPIMILLACEMIFAICWLSIDPLKHVGVPNVNNKYQTYDHCDCDHKTVWVSFTVLEKAVLAFYGIYLATKTRNVPKAYNESKLMAFSLYNIAFSVLIGILMVYLTQPNDDLDTPYLTQVIVILWSCMWTCSALIVPRIYYILNPPGADFFSANSKKYSVGGSRGISQGGGSNRKLTATERPTSTSSSGTSTRPASASTATRPASASTATRPASGSTAVRPASASIANRPAIGKPSMPKTNVPAASAVAAATSTPVVKVDDIEMTAIAPRNSPSSPSGPVQLPRKVSLIEINEHLPPSVDVAALADQGMKEHTEIERRKSQITTGSAGLLAGQFGSSSTPPESPETSPPASPKLGAVAERKPSAPLSPAEMDSSSSESDDETLAEPSRTGNPTAERVSAELAAATPATGGAGSVFSLRANVHRPSLDLTSEGGIDFNNIQPRPPAHSFDGDAPAQSSSTLPPAPTAPFVPPPPPGDPEVDSDTEL